MKSNIIKIYFVKPVFIIIAISDHSIKLNFYTDSKEESSPVTDSIDVLWNSDIFIQIVPHEIVQLPDANIKYLKKGKNIALFILGILIRVLYIHVHLSTMAFMPSKER